MNEEQQEEIEALEAIYPDEFTLIDSSPPGYKIHLVPDPNSDDCDNHVGISLMVKIPLDYPNEIPSFEIEIEKGLGKKQCDEIMDVARNIATENIGIASTFAVAEAVREWLVDNNVAGQDGSMYAQMMLREKLKDVEDKRAEERKAIARAADAEVASVEVDDEELQRIRIRQQGTPVTVESFMEWKIKFEEEMRLLREKDGVIDKDTTRPTGKELFQTNRAGMEDALLAAAASEELAAQAEAAGEAAMADEVGDNSGVAVATNLFLAAAAEDLELDFDSSEEEDDDDDDDDEDEDGGSSLEPDSNSIKV